MVNQQLGGAIIDIPQALMTIANLMTIEVSVWTKYFLPFIGELAMTALENQMLWGDPAVAEMHAKGLATILHRTGGLLELKGYLRMGFCLYQWVVS
jgi:hypothetical protein